MVGPKQCVGAGDPCPLTIRDTGVKARFAKRRNWRTLSSAPCPTMQVDGRGAGPRQDTGFLLAVT
ncbi:MAG: hypothetical protein ACJAQW_001259 [Paracoccaceae bacterium]|jgi:hypothetical protein